MISQIKLRNEPDKYLPNLCVIAVVDDTGSASSHRVSYGAIHERDSGRQRNSIFRNASVSDAENRQWDLNYREAALYLKVFSPLSVFS